MVIIRVHRKRVEIVAVTQGARDIRPSWAARPIVSQMDSRTTPKLFPVPETNLPILGLIHQPSPGLRDSSSFGRTGDWPEPGISLGPERTVGTMQPRTNSGNCCAPCFSRLAIGWPRMTWAREFSASSGIRFTAALALLALAFRPRNLRRSRPIRLPHIAARTPSPPHNTAIRSRSTPTAVSAPYPQQPQCRPAVRAFIPESPSSRISRNSGARARPGSQRTGS